MIFRTRLPLASMTRREPPSGMTWPAVEPVASVGRLPTITSPFCSTPRAPVRPRPGGRLEEGRGRAVGRDANDGRAEALLAARVGGGAGVVEVGNQQVAGMERIAVTWSGSLAARRRRRRGSGRRWSRRSRRSAPGRSAGWAGRRPWGFRWGRAWSEPRRPPVAPNFVAGASTRPAVKNRVLALPVPAPLPKRRAQRFSMVIGLPAALLSVPRKLPLCGSKALMVSVAEVADEEVAAEVAEARRAQGQPPGGVELAARP